MIELFLGMLKNHDVKYTEYYATSRISSFKTGGEAKVFILPDDENKLITTVRWAKKLNINCIVVGNSTNILYSDKGFDGAVICTKRINRVSLNGDIITCDAGALLSKVCHICMNKSIGGFERLFGIPGTVGGGVVSNAGAFGFEIGELTQSIKVYDKLSEQIITLDRSDCKFGYRDSIFKQNKGRYIILSVNLKGYVSDKHNIVQQMQSYVGKRRSSQPSLPSLGSSFKRPLNDFASRLIDKAGLKGYSIGGASISPVHAGFIVNTGNARSEDYQALIELCTDVVKEKFSVDLEPEIVILSENG